MNHKSLFLTLLLFLCVSASPIDLIPEYQICPQGARLFQEYYYDSTEWVALDPVEITKSEEQNGIKLTASRKLSMGIKTHLSRYEGKKATANIYNYSFADAYDKDTIYTTYNDAGRVESIRHRFSTGSRFPYACHTYDTLTIRIYDKNGVHCGDTLYTKESGYMAKEPDTLIATYTFGSGTHIDKKEYYSLREKRIVAKRQYSYPISGINEAYYKADSTGELKLYRKYKLYYDKGTMLEKSTPDGTVYEITEMLFDSERRLTEMTTFEPTRNRGRKVAYSYDDPTAVTPKSSAIRQSGSIQLHAKKISYSNPSLQSSGSYALYSLTGQIVHQGEITGTSFSVDMKNISKGVYLLKVTCGNLTETYKVEY